MCRPLESPYMPFEVETTGLTKQSVSQIETRLANMPSCLIGMEGCVGAHHLSRTLHLYGQDAPVTPTKIRAAPPMILQAALDHKMAPKSGLNSVVMMPVEIAP